jgi:CubicO group peptidase (beta-lactamase class C family)
MARGYKVTTVAVVVALAALDSSVHGQSLAFSLFERYLEPLRVQAGIPGLSAAIVQDGQIVWESAFGMADLESNVRARPDTPYNIADLTETFTTLLLAQCAERGLLQPEDPIGKWVPEAAEPPATLRQILSHTSSPSAVFRFEPSRFALLTHVVEACASVSYKQALSQSILERASMTDSSPGRDIAPAVADGEPLFDSIAFDRYAAVLQRLATPYKVDKQRGRTTRSELPPPTMDAATGLIASVRDLAKYDAALDVIVRPTTLAETWTNVKINEAVQPTTMGWFGQTYEGQRLIWQFGLVPDAYSSLILKIPARRLTLILLANSDGLSSPFPLQEGDVTASLFARTFLRLFF